MWKQVLRDCYMVWKSKISFLFLMKGEGREEECCFFSLLSTSIVYCSTALQGNTAINKSLHHVGLDGLHEVQNYNEYHKTKENGEFSVVK